MNSYDLGPIKAEADYEAALTEVEALSLEQVRKISATWNVSADLPIAGYPMVA